MKKTDYLVWLSIAVAAGGALGVLADRNHAARGVLLGAVAGAAAGLAAVGAYEHVTREEIPYYTSLSPLYEEAEVA